MAARVSHPVISGELVAAIGIGAPTQRLMPADVNRLAPVIEAVEDAARGLGYRPGSRLVPRRPEN
ncbi:hypothetical protein ACFRCW_22895 [Streptomyces sp. NPDC056653]|uniref:hypothetical protein n=1 Tax=Streptomyces sp. NPDC056653 TaxID=3345894 RepID=UPI0036A0FE2C